MSDEPAGVPRAMVAGIVAAYVSYNRVSAGAVPEVIEAVHRGLTEAASPPVVIPAGRVAVGERPSPAVPIKQSVWPDYIICLEDGSHHTTMKRYLARKFGLTPDQYRERWGLPSNYPMAAPNYSASRSEMFKAYWRNWTEAGRSEKGRVLSEVA